MEDFQAERIASVIGCLHDWRDELVSRPLDSVEVGVGVLLDLGSDSDTNRIDWKIRVINLLKRKLTVDSGDCNLSPRRHVPDLNQSDSGSKQHVDWLLYQRATVLSTISPHMSVTSSINPYDVSILTCGDGQSTKLTVNASQLRPFDKIIDLHCPKRINSITSNITVSQQSENLLSATETAASSAQLFPEGLNVGMEMMISWGELRGDIFVAAVLEFIEYDSHSPVVGACNRPAISNLIFSLLAPTEPSNQDRPASTRYRISLNECDLCYYPHSQAYINKNFFAACRNIIPTSYAAFSLSNNLAGIMSVLTVRCKDYADIVGTHMDQLLNQQFESEQIESHAADNLNKEQEIAQIVPRCQRALYRTVSESASYLTVVAALSHSVKSTSTSTAADSSSVDHLMAMLNDVMKVSLLTPHVVTVISFRSWIQTTSALLDLRVRILSFFSVVDSINNPDLVDPPTLEIVKESLRRFEDTIDIDIKDRMVKEISQFIEVHFMDDVIRQEWTSNSAYRRNQRTTPGVLSSFLMIRGLLFDLSTIAGHHRYFVCDVSSALLNSLLGIIIQVYSALTPSRVRLHQWELDMKFAILATIHTIKCIIDKGLLVLETPSGGAISSEYLIAAEQKINHDPLPWLLKLITANGDTPQAIYEIFANIDDASWSDEINVSATAGLILANIQLLKLMVYIHSASSVDELLLHIRCFRGESLKQHNVFSSLIPGNELAEMLRKEIMETISTLPNGFQ